MSDNEGDRAAETDAEEQTEEVDAVAVDVEAIRIRQAIRGTTFRIIMSGDVKKKTANARSFAELSQGNDTVQEIMLFLDTDYARDYELLRVLGESFGNLRALRVVTVNSRGHTLFDEGDYDLTEPEVGDELLYWQAFAGALGRVRYHIELHLNGNWCSHVNFTNFAVAIQGVLTIRSFRSGEHALPWRDANTLMSALATLPSLENVTLGNFINDIPGVELDGLTNLMRRRPCDPSSSLRCIA
jgi:hypothetical protein